MENDLSLSNRGTSHAANFGSSPSVRASSPPTLAEITATAHQILNVLVDQILMFDPVSVQLAYARGFRNIIYPGPNDEAQVTSGMRVGWGDFLDVWDHQEAHRRTEMASTKLETCDCYLLHIVCACSAPRDVVQRLIQSSPSHVLLHPCGLQLGATPLHLACFFHCSLEVVVSLVETERKALFRKDAQGRLALHLACGTGTSFASRDIVRFLLQSDPDLTSLDTRDTYGLSPLQLASQFARSDVVEAVLLAYMAAGNESTDINGKVAQVRAQLPLHRALQRSSSNVPVGLVRALSAKSFSLPSEPDVLTSRDRQGQIPLHVAIHHGATVETFQALIGHDCDGKTFSACDDCQQSPLDVLLKQILHDESRSLRTLQQLAAADPSRRIFQAVDSLGLTMFDRLVKHLFLEKNRQQSPVQVKALLSLMCCTPPGSGQYAVSIGSCRRVLDATFFDQLYEDPRFHGTLNNLMCERKFTFYFMVDLYVRIALVTFYTLCSNAAVQGFILNPGYFSVVYLCCFYLMAWQLRLVWYHQLYYLGEFWNLLDLVTNLLVLVSLAMLQSGSTNQGANRVLNVLVGGLVWFVVVAAALRSSFKPFSVFLSGFTMVYAMFVSGVDGSLLTTETALNLLLLTTFYGFLFAIVLLNVLVAVVFDAWGRVSPFGERIFYEYRFAFLTETAETSHRRFHGKLSSCLTFQWADRFTDQLLESFRRRPREFGEAALVAAKLLIFAKYVWEGIMLAVLFILGVCSAGVMWPTVFRRFIFSIGTEEERASTGMPANHSMRNEVDIDSARPEPKVSSTAAQEELFRLRDELRDISRNMRQLEASVRQLLDSTRHE